MTSLMFNKFNSSRFFNLSSNSETPQLYSRTSQLPKHLCTTAVPPHSTIACKILQACTLHLRDITAKAPSLLFESGRLLRCICTAICTSGYSGPEAGLAPTYVCCSAHLASSLSIIIITITRKHHFIALSTKPS